MDMQQQERNTWRGYWGTVRTCTAAWMTVADVLIKTDNLNPGTFSKFKKKNSELDYEDVVGCPILIFGALKKSANDRLFVAVEGTTAVVILK
ncbi:hypothetical protein WSM22_40540 [Cytophagales bacterium WSM2-2]|nr:hypothetical protein WSM22_40540 [Cytophagales bacterium WSM2-2]